MEFTVLIVLLFASYKPVLGDDLTHPTSQNTGPVHFNSTGLNLKRDVRFFLYTRINQQDPHRLYIENNTALQKSVYSFHRATKFVTHGWQNSYKSPSCVLMREGFLYHGDYNVIVIDWGTIANKHYVDSSSRVQAVGAYVAKMIDFLVQLGTDPMVMSLAGHSLGAHVIGIAGLLANTSVAHIVGLDPAGPGFYDMGPEGRITSEDAVYVEIVHSDFDKLGINMTCGRADFFPNGGGPQQPGCGVDLFGTCAHSRSFMYYAESLRRPSAWYAVRCNSFADFKIEECNGSQVEPFPRWGADFDKPDGKYMLRTSNAAPFGLGMRGTRPNLEAEIILARARNIARKAEDIADETAKIAEDVL